MSRTRRAVVLRQCIQQFFPFFCEFLQITKNRDLHNIWFIHIIWCTVINTVEPQ